MISTAWCSDSTSRSGTIRRRWGTCSSRQTTLSGRCKVSDVAQLTMGSAPASIDRYDRQRQITVNASLDGAVARHRARRDADQGRGDAPEARVPGGVRRQRANPERSVERLRHRHRPGRHVHLHGARVTVQQLHLPALDHVVAAAEPAGRPARAAGVRHDAERLQRHRHADALRHRQEELDSPGGLHQHAARAGHRAARRDRGGQPRPAAPDPDDDAVDHRRHAADRVRPRRGRGVAGVDGGDDSRRPDAVSAPHAARHTGGVLVLRRHARNRLVRVPAPLD